VTDVEALWPEQIRANVFDKLEPALKHALAAFREQRHERKRIIVLPPDSPWMWD